MLTEKQMDRDRQTDRLTDTRNLMTLYSQFFQRATNPSVLDTSSSVSLTVIEGFQLKKLTGAQFFLLSMPTSEYRVSTLQQFLKN